MYMLLAELTPLIVLKVLAACPVCLGRNEDNMTHTNGSSLTPCPAKMSSGSEVDNDTTCWVLLERLTPALDTERHVVGLLRVVCINEQF